MKDYPLRLGTISKYFAINNMIKTGLKGVAFVVVVVVHFIPIDTNDILDIHNYLIKRTCIK